jgi:hypothetical protein
MKTIKGIDFIDSNGFRVRNFSLVGDDGYAVAIIDFDGTFCRRLAFTEAVSPLIDDWLKEVCDLMNDRKTT